MLNNIFSFKNIFQENRSQDNKVWMCLITNWSDDTFPNVFFEETKEKIVFHIFDLFSHAITKLGM